MYRFEFRFSNAEVSNICRMKSDICILIVLTCLCVTSCIINSVSEKINFLHSEANLSVGPVGVKIVMICCKELPQSKSDFERRLIEQSYFGVLNSFIPTI